MRALPLVLAIACAAPSHYEEPWFRSWDTSEEHEQLVREYPSDNAAIELAYELACGAKPVSHIAVSPLLRFRTNSWNTSSGVIVHLSPLAGTADELLAALRCHRAWMLRDPGTIAGCPLDLPGLQLDARGDAERITLAVSVRDPRLVPELQRRMANQVEAITRNVHEGE